MNVRILGARKMEAKGARHACFLIDDRLAVDAGGLTSALALDEQDRLRGVLMTHHHSFYNDNDIGPIRLDT